jgi:hypothetical protein
MQKMLSLLISILVSTAGVIAGLMNDLSTGLLITIAIAGLLLPQILLGLLLRKKTATITADLQGMIMAGQKRMNHKIQQFQCKPGGNPKTIQRQLEGDQQELFKKALEFTSNFEPLRKWNLLMGKQISTMRLQFLYQLKEFKQVDEIFAQGPLTAPMMMEPLMVAMKMARQYKNDDIDGAEKTFKRRVKWFKGDRASLLYGLMSWIYVKQGESEKAHQLLIKGKTATGNETLASNLNHLSNRKEKSFSNAGLGDEWFGLYLENPPNPKQQRMRGNAKGGRRF